MQALQARQPQQMRWRRKAPLLGVASSWEGENLSSDSWAPPPQAPSPAAAASPGLHGGPSVQWPTWRSPPVGDQDRVKEAMLPSTCPPRPLTSDLGHLAPVPCCLYCSHLQGALILDQSWLQDSLLCDLGPTQASLSLFPHQERVGRTPPASSTLLRTPSHLTVITALPSPLEEEPEQISSHSCHPLDGITPT